MRPYINTPVILPDGEYHGKWSGYTIDIEYPGQAVKVRTRDGVRGMNCPVKFTISAGLLVDDSIERLTVAEVDR